MVQEYALEVSLILEERQKVSDFRDRLKMALVAHDPEVYSRRMFPDWFTSESGPKIEVPVEDFHPDATEGEWKFTSEANEEEVMDVLRSLGQIPVRIGGDEVLDGGWQ